MPLNISKSKYLAGLQCPKLLWTYYNAKEEIPEVDAATQAKFDQGHEVGNLAKRLFPGGIEVAWEDDLGKTIQQTKALIPQRKPIFEGSLAYGGVYARADILKPVPAGKWDIIEVKSTTEVKDVHFQDLAIQRYCYEGAGLPVRRCRLMHIDYQYVRHGDVDPAGLFATEDITDKVDEASEGLRSRVKEMLDIVGCRKCPEVDIGPHCSDPYPCPLRDACWAKVWKFDDNIFTLRRGNGEKLWELYEQGVLRNSRLPEGCRLSGQQHIQVEAERTGRCHVDTHAVRRFLDTLKPPLYYLDFETFQTAIPLIDGSRPYRQIPFQFSLHVAAALRSKPKHYSWLWDGQGDPRRMMLEQLKPLLGGEGSIVSYSAKFEKGRLAEAAEAMAGMAPRPL